MNDGEGPGATGADLAVNRTLVKLNVKKKLVYSANNNRYGRWL